MLLMLLVLSASATKESFRRKDLEEDQRHDETNRKECVMTEQVLSPTILGLDADELAEWYESLDDLALREGGEQVKRLLATLLARLQRQEGTSGRLCTPYVNTIPVADQPVYPGDQQLERRIRHFIRWNAMAMVVRANREHHGIGGHISTYASAATLWEVAFNHFLHARTEDHPGDLVFFQGHASPGCTLAPTWRADSPKTSWSDFVGRVLAKWASRLTHIPG